MRLPNNDEIFIMLAIIGILMMVIPQVRVEVGGIGLIIVFLVFGYYWVTHGGKGK